MSSNKSDHLTPDEVHGVVQRLTETGEHITMTDIAEATNRPVEEIRAILAEMLEPEPEASLEERIAKVEGQQEILAYTFQEYVPKKSALPVWWRPEGSRFSSFNPHQEPTYDYSDPRSMLRLFGFRLLLLVAWVIAASGMFVGWAGFVYLMQVR